jgi:uncharacterized protein YndB with AHSA1/START domain
MNVAVDTKGIVVERTMPHPPEKVWRALTQAPLVADWLMPNDFQAVVGHKFRFRMEPPPPGGWDGIVESEVLEVEPPTRLVYRWDTTGEKGLRTVVAYTLEPRDGGTHLRMEQTGFKPHEEFNRRGAMAGFTHMLEGLERVAGTL